MKTQVAVWCAVMVAASVFADGVKVGDKAPMTDAKLKNVDGKEVTIAGVTGKNGTLVIFTCNHCPFAKAWEKRIAELGNAAGKEGVGVIAINSNDPDSYAEDSYENMQKRAKAVGFEFPYAVDATSDVARAFGASRTPEAFLFDKEGKLVYHGAVDDNKDASKVAQTYLKEALDDVVAGKPVANAETKAVGCGIKFRAKA
jgi:peroxiredoxin